MAISAISAVGTFNGTTAAVPAQVRAAQPDPTAVASFADPSAIVSLGGGGPGGALFDVAGLLRSLLQVDPASIAPPSPEPGSPEAELQGDLATLLGLNTDTTSAGILATTGAFRGLSADTTRALGNVLTARLGEATPEQTDAALSALLATAANFTATGLNPATTVAGALEATGLLQTPGVATGQALNGLLGADLGLAATVLNTNAATAGTAGLLLNPADDATSRALATVLAANLELAASNVTPQEGGDQATTTDVLLSNVNLTAANAGIATTGAIATAAAPLVEAAAAAVTAPLTAAPAVAGAVAALPTVPGATPAAIETPAAVPAVAPAAAPVATATPTVPGQAAASVLQALVADAAVRARATVAADPTYASAAASLYAGTAVFRYRVQDVVPGAAIPTRPVAVIPGVTPVKAA